MGLGFLEAGSLDGLQCPVSPAPLKDRYKWAIVACSQNVLLGLIASSASWLAKGWPIQDPGLTCKYHLPVGSYSHFQTQWPRIRKDKGRAGEWRGFYKNDDAAFLFCNQGFMNWNFTSLSRQPRGEMVKKLLLSLRSFRNTCTVIPFPP